MFCFILFSTIIISEKLFFLFHFFTFFRLFLFSDVSFLNFLLIYKIKPPYFGPRSLQNFSSSPIYCSFMDTSTYALIEFQINSSLNMNLKFCFSYNRANYFMTVFICFYIQGYINIFLANCKTKVNL